jgi:single-stranded-DNA-specific exonuclease
MGVLAPRWEVMRLSAAEEAEARELAAHLGWPVEVAGILVRRGVRTAAEAELFLKPSLGALHAPGMLRGMPAAVARIRQALAGQELVLLYGDYDVDGTSAIVILKTVLDLLGARTLAFVPHRIEDGYGMKVDRLEAAAAEGVRLVISVDTGIRAGEVVRHGNRLGLDTIVTDHHLPESELPPAVAVLNPNQPGCEYPNKHLCGAGVALKLAQAVLEAAGWPEAKRERLLLSLLKIAALATIADVAPLTGENRVMVQMGLAGLAEVKQPGLRALLDVAGIGAGQAPESRQVAFQVAPRLNAAGRMASAMDVLELFFTSDAQRAREIARQLDEQNRERQAIQRRMQEEIEGRLRSEAIWEERMGLVLAGEGWHLGVAGIVAGRIAEEQAKPVFVLAAHEAGGRRYWKGSGRSAGDFHLLDALEALKGLLVQFGGHAQAAGVTLAEENLAAFVEGFAAYAAGQLDAESRRPRLGIDAVVSVREVGVKLFEELEQLAPFGYGNPAPVLAVEGVEVVGTPQPIKEKHLRMTVRQAGAQMQVKAWNAAPEWFQLGPGQRLDLAFALEADRYDGWAAVVKDLRRA